MNSIIVACKTIGDELNKVIKETGCKYPVLWIESGLHNYPDSLRKRLQEELDHITNVDQIILAFGFCGNSLIGLKSSSSRIVFPRVDDCITLFLGSQERRKEIQAESGTYFLTKGWLDYEKNLWAEYQDTVKRHGKERADRIYKTILQHYKRLGIVETGAYDIDEFLKKSQSMAEDLKLKTQVIPGTLDYLKKLLNGPWDDDFIVLEPGETVSFSHIYEVKKS